MNDLTSRCRKFTISLFKGNSDPSVVQVIEERNITFEQLPNHISQQTYSLIRFKNRYRSTANFETAACAALDVDEDLSIDEAINRLKTRNLIALVATSRNHQKIKTTKGGTQRPPCDRFRIIFLLANNVENPADHRATIIALREIFPESDKGATGEARYFFPSPKIVFTNFNGEPFEPMCGTTTVASLLKGKNTQSKIVESLQTPSGTIPNILPGINTEAAAKRALEYLKVREPAIEGHGGDSHTLGTAMKLMDFGVLSPEACCELLETSGWNSRCIPPWSQKELLKKCRNAFKYRENPIGASAPEAVFSEGKEKPTIKIQKNRLHSLVNESETALISAKSGLYARGSSLVFPVVDELEASHGRKTFVTRLKVANPVLIRLFLSKVANWCRWNDAKGAYLPADPPIEIAESILQRDGAWTFPPLAGVITCPTLRRDGSILAEAGYDPLTRLLLVGVPDMPEIPSAPSKRHAEEALKILEDLLIDFPYVDQASRSVALSMLITPVVRGALSSAPLHAVRATSAGSGKSFSTDIPACIISGKPCPVVAAGRNEEETEKRLGAVIRTGQPIINIDNVNGELGGDALCQLVERPTVQIRLLGRSEIIEVESKATVFATGNGLVLTGDMTRRVLLCSLDANLERPELRQFTSNPVAKVLDNRGRYISAAIIIVRAYIEAGCPGALPALASFNDWSRLVRSALVWLGKADPVETMNAARAEDPQTVQFGQVLAAWKSALGVETKRTAGELSKELRGDSFSGPISPEMESLFLALNVVASDRLGKNIDPTRLGKWLSKHNGKVALGLKLVGERDRHTETNRWSLRPHSPPLPG